MGEKNPQTIACDGGMYSAEEAERLGLVDQVSSVETLANDAEKTTRRFAAKDGAAFRSIKTLLRKPVVEEMAAAERSSLREFADIWYSASTWKNLQAFTIRS